MTGRWTPGASRDPRFTPLVGDEIARQFITALGGCIIRKVTRAHGGFVFFDRDNGYRVTRKIVTLDKWRRWAKSAEVL